MHYLPHDFARELPPDYSGTAGQVKSEGNGTMENRDTRISSSPSDGVPLYTYSYTSPMYSYPYPGFLEGSSFPPQNRNPEPQPTVREQIAPSPLTYGLFGWQPPTTNTGNSGVGTDSGSGGGHLSMSIWRD